MTNGMMTTPGSGFTPCGMSTPTCQFTGQNLNDGGMNNLLNWVTESIEEGR